MTSSFLSQTRSASILYIHFLMVKKNARFLRNSPLAFLIISVCQSFYGRRKYVRVRQDVITDFSCGTCTTNLYYVMCGFDCLRRRFCAEFQTHTCNIIYKFAVLSATRKGCPESFSHGTDSHGLSNGCQTQNLSQTHVSRKRTDFL